MTEMSKIEIPVTAATAAALVDGRRLEAVGRLIDRFVRPGADDPLSVLFERTAAEAQDAGWTEADIDAELELYNQSKATQRPYHANSNSWA